MSYSFNILKLLIVLIRDCILSVDNSEIFRKFTGFSRISNFSHISTRPFQCESINSALKENCIYFNISDCSRDGMQSLSDSHILAHFTVESPRETISPPLKKVLHPSKKNPLNFVYLSRITSSATKDFFIPVLYDRGSISLSNCNSS